MFHIIQRTTFQEDNEYRVYGTSQNWDKITNRTTLPGVQLSASGSLLITGINFTKLKAHATEELMKNITFYYTDATRS
jgi:hypothetical protein